MKNFDKTDIENLSKEELISLLLEQSGKQKESDEENQALRKEVESLREEKEAWRKEAGHWKNMYETELQKVKKANLERFVTKDDNVCLTSQERKAYSRKKLPPSNDGKPAKKKAQRIYSREDLEKLSDGNEVYQNDILPELQAEHPDWEFVKVGEDVTFVIERVKAHVEIHKVITSKYKSKNDREHIFQKESMAPIPHSYVGPSLLADICTAKFQFGMPIYRYSKWMAGCGFDFSQRTLYGYVIKAAEILWAVYATIENVIREGKAKCMGIDETVLRVIDSVREGRESCYVYLVNCESEGRKIRFFHYTGTRESDYIKRLLKDYAGAIVVDGYSGYDAMPEAVSRQRCLAHCRRRFADIAKTLTDAQKADSSAYKAVKLIDRIFADEAKIKEMNLTPDQVLEQRNSDWYMKDVDEFRSFAENLKYADDSPLGEAMRYYLNGGDDFFTFLSCGDVPIDNNGSERLAKEWATNRRGFLFCRSEKGAEAASVLTTVIKTAEANGLYPDEYLTYVFSHAGNLPASKLMPWSEGIRDNPRIVIKK